jgi:hypothetical protein
MLPFITYFLLSVRLYFGYGGWQTILMIGKMLQSLPLLCWLAYRSSGVALEY